MRRKFYDISQSHPSPIAGEMIRRIGALYTIEAQIRGQPAERRREIRMAQTQPLLDDMRRWLTSLLPTLSSKAALAGAIQYAFNRWEALNVFARDGCVEIDNNAVEGRCERCHWDARTSCSQARMRADIVPPRCIA